MSYQTYIGIDNGITGSIGIAGDNRDPQFHITPIKKSLNYTRKVGWTHRIDTVKLQELLCVFCDSFVLIERPFVNPKMFKASVSAIRAMEASIIVFEQLGVPYEFIDSKKWQKAMLGEGIKGAKDLKIASLQTGIRLFPQFEEMFTKQKDADGMLIAEWGRRVKF
jgi:hypothetical protein